jgi:glutamine synthetase
MKVPHLKSLHAIGRAATKVASLFDPSVGNVRVNLGIEQEYFVVDESLYNARADLVLTGRTVLGHTSAKDQQLDDHYFGAIPSRVVGFMKDFETEAYKLGIRLQTRHNEVAPNQFECAPMFSGATVSIDQNMLLMIIMQKVAEKHHLKVIFHEKPFDGVNGSGKHCNWSLSSDTGVNLLSPGSTPMKNLQFLSFFSCVMRAVRRHDYLLMASTSSLNNSYRLGGAEAPPAVMSIFAGSTLYKVFEALAGLSSGPSANGRVESLDIVASIPEIFPDNTDRNRTSPFAFSGNRFEFRAVGSSVNPASSMYVLNAAVAESLEDFYSAVMALRDAGTPPEDAVMSVIKDFVKESFDILFEGNGYSEQWHEEARRRGLRAVTNVPDSFKAFIEKESLDMFESTGVLSRAETLSRYEVFNESYVKKLQIEARVIGDICKNHIIPAAIAYKNVLSGDIERARKVFPDEWESLCAASISAYRKISHLVNRLSEDLEALVEERKKANSEPDMARRASMYSHSVASCMKDVRGSADKLEMIVDDELWPIPKYRELLFL